MRVLLVDAVQRRNGRADRPVLDWRKRGDSVEFDRPPNGSGELGIVVTSPRHSQRAAALCGDHRRVDVQEHGRTIGGLVAGCYAGLMGTKVVAMSGLGVFALAGFLSDNVMNLVNYLIAIALGMLVTFVITLITFKEKKEA